MITKFMTSQTGQQLMTIHILPNISRIKGHQTIKFDREKYFSPDHAENEAGGLVKDLLFKKIAPNRVKASGQHLSFDIFWQTKVNHKIFQTFYPEICSIVIFCKRVWV